MKKSLVVTFLIYFCSLTAQDSLQQRSIVTVSLLSPVVSYTPRWNAGYIHNISNRWLAGVEVGYGSSNTAINVTDHSDLVTGNYKLFEVRPQVYYNLRAAGKLKHLLSLELFYISHRDRFTTDTFYDLSELKSYRYDSADYSRVKTGFNANLNTLYYLGKRFVLWQTVGVGIRNRYVKYSNVVNPVELDTSSDDEGPGGDFGIKRYIEENGPRTGFNFNLDLKLAYTF